MARWRLARWRLFKTGKLSVREVYHDDKNDDNDHNLMTLSNWTAYSVPPTFLMITTGLSPLDISK
jgi:hypothetical protein